MATKVRYRVVLVHSDEGVAVSCPALPGCWSQGSNDDDALKNIADAIRDYLTALEDLHMGDDVREVEVVM